MFAFLFIISILIPIITGQPCEDSVSIELIDTKPFSDGTIVHQGISFPPKYVYSKMIDGEVKTFGCVCKVKKCFRKCCEPGYVNYNRSCVQMPEFDSFTNDGIRLHFMNHYQRTVDLLSSHFFILYGKPCLFAYREPNDVFVQEDGKLYVDVPNNIPPWLVAEPDSYCIDNFVMEHPDGNKTTEVDALVCSIPDTITNINYLISSTCMLISCVFILVTVAVYMWLPQLHNIHGRVLIAYLLCLFVGFSVLASMQLLLLTEHMTPEACMGMSFVIYMSLLSSFFWLNVMSFDIWRVFGGKREIRLEKMFVRSKLRAYAIYAFGVPTLLTILVASLEFSGLPPSPWMPNLRYQGCFLSGTGKLIYFYGPIVILCTTNATLFILTALKIAKTKKEASVLKSRDSSRSDQQNNDTQRLFLYVKLFIVMGINWILEVLSSLYPSDYWVYSDVYNVLIGLTIFIIFVCKRKIMQLLKERNEKSKKEKRRGTLEREKKEDDIKEETRYKAMRRDPVSQSQTSWSRANSSKDEMALTTR